MGGSFSGLVASVARQWRRAVDARLRPLGLTEATWLPLLHLARAEQPMRQKDLAETLGIDGSSLVRLIDALATAGYLRRQEAPDRRANTLVLTQDGVALTQEVETIAAALRAEVLAGIPEADLDVARGVLLQVQSRLAVLQRPTP